MECGGTILTGESEVLEQGWRTYGTRVQNGTRKGFLGTQHSLLSYVFFSFARPASLYCEEYVYTHTHTYLTAHRLYMNYRCYQTTLQVKHFYTNLERCEVLTGYLSLGCRTGDDWGNTWHWAKRFTVFFFKQQVAASPVTAIFSSLRIAREGLYKYTAH
jgi:hypothetical protein